VKGKIIISVGIILVFVLFLSGHSQVQNRPQPIPQDKPDYAEGRVIVKFNQSIGREHGRQVAASYNLEMVQEYPAISRALGFEYSVLASKTKTTPQLIQELSRDLRFAVVEPDYIRSIDSVIPNDPGFPDLWGLHNTGQDGGTTDIDIDAPEAWDLTTGSGDVVVAIIDTGIDYTHPDLQANIWTNPGETPDNGIDDDGNGWVDDIHGINAIVETGDPMDDNAHGTHVAGTIGAESNNSTGVAGVNWNVKMIGAKFLNDIGWGYTSDHLQCLDYVYDLKASHGINIVAVNASYGGGDPSTAVSDAITALGTQGILFCAAAGNDDEDNDTSPHYPSSYPLDNIIAVTAVNRTGGQVYNYGATSVDLGAPGISILSSLCGFYSPESGDLFYDDMESGAGKWTTGGTNNTWAISTDQEIWEDPDWPVPSPPNFWSDSPGTNYAADTNSYLMTSTNLDLSSYTDSPVYLGFGAATFIEIAPWDHGYVEVSGDGGSTWTPIADHAGYIYLWYHYFNYALPDKVKTSQFRLRFRLTSDSLLEYAGWLLDNIGIGTDVTQGYTFFNGTSMATPHVTGAAALTAAYFPSESMANRKARILNNVTPLGSLSGKCVTGGMLNLYNALTDTPAVSGTVTVWGEGLENVYMNGLPHDIFTDAEGDYTDYVLSGWGGTVTPALTGYTFIPADRNYTDVTSDQTGQNYTADPDDYTISGTVNEDGFGPLSGVNLIGLPGTPVTAGDGTYSGTIEHGWSGAAVPALSGYIFEPRTRDYSSITSGFSNQDYTADMELYNSPDSYVVIPEVLWAPASGGGEWKTEVQITDVIGGAEVSVYFNSSTGDRRGPIALYTSAGRDTSVKTGNLLQVLDTMDSGYSYYGKAGAVEFVTQDEGHRIHVLARTSNGDYSKTFPGLTAGGNNVVSGAQTMMIQNLVSNDTYRTAYGGFNPTDNSITVEYELFDGSGTSIGTAFTKTFTTRQYRALNVFSEAGVPYPANSFSNVYLKISRVSGSGQLMSYGATANNITNDPAVHPAVRADTPSLGYNCPSDYKVIPEVLWAPASGGGDWKTEVQITDMTGGSEVSVYYNCVTGDRRGPFLLFTGSSAGVSVKTPSLLQTLQALDPGFSYYGTAGAVEFGTQGSSHKIHVIARTYCGNYSKTFQGLSLVDENTAGYNRPVMVQNLASDSTYRTAFGVFNPGSNPVTAEFTIMDQNGNTVGTSFSKTINSKQFTPVNPFVEAGVPYPGDSYSNTWIKVDVTLGSDQIFVYGATANNTTSDPAVHRVVQY
jgi:subtilisin family serine protease